MMSPLVASVFALLLILAGCFAGSLLRHALPEHHLNEDSKDVIRLGSGLLATLTALVLGLLISSAKSSYDTQSTQIGQMTAEIVLLDYVLAEYGPDAHEIRQLLRDTVNASTRAMWRGSDSVAEPAPARPFHPSIFGARLNSAILALSPQTPNQRFLQSQAEEILKNTAQLRLILFVQSGSSIPTPFVTVLVLWLTIIFATFTLFHQPNATTRTALFIFAFSASCAIFLILEMDQAFSGLMKIPSAQLTHALAPLELSK